jgi:hypothetical protein
VRVNLSKKRFTVGAGHEQCVYICLMVAAPTLPFDFIGSQFFSLHFLPLVFSIPTDNSPDVRNLSTPLRNSLVSPLHNRMHTTMMSNLLHTENSVGHSYKLISRMQRNSIITSVSLQHTFTPMQAAAEGQILSCIIVPSTTACSLQAQCARRSTSAAASPAKNEPTHDSHEPLY